MGFENSCVNVQTQILGVLCLMLGGDKTMSITGSEVTECSLNMSSESRTSSIHPDGMFAPTIYPLTDALCLSWVILSSLGEFMPALEECYMGLKSSLSFASFLPSTRPHPHHHPHGTASFPHNPCLWLLFRVGPGDRRCLTECICVYTVVYCESRASFFYRWNLYMLSSGWLDEVRKVSNLSQ